MEQPVRRSLLVGLVVLVAASLVLPVSPAAAATESQEVVYRRITFPVQGGASYSNTWMACRDGCTRNHHGADIFGRKLQVLVAAHDGTVGWTRTDGNNMLSIRDEDGWQYWYIHINNDTPGTDDGANPMAAAFFPGIEEGVEVTAGQPIAYLGDSGNAEGTAPHLHFEIHPPDGSVVNSYWSLMLAQGRRVNNRCRFSDTPEPAEELAAGGYWSATADGGVYSYGGAPFHGSMAGTRLNAPIISLTSVPDGSGYWQLSADGGVFSFGDAGFHGSTGGRRLNQPIVGMAPTPTGNGYWLVARDGGVFAFGDAGFHGSTGSRRLNQPIIGMTTSPTGNGYWLTATDGGVFAFGDAPFAGSTGGRVPAPVVDMAATESGRGYWMLTSAGSVLPFGDAEWKGGVAQVGFCAVPTSVKLATTSTGDGYWIQTSDGNAFAFGDARDVGSIKRSGLRTQPIVDLAAR
jgi:hypothetical protein